MKFTVNMGVGGRSKRMYLYNANNVVVRGFDGGINAVMDYLRHKYKGRTVVGGRIYGRGTARRKEIHVI